MKGVSHISEIKQKDNWVIKSHSLNEMILNTDIKPIEYKLILIGISMINPKPGGFENRELSVTLPLETYASIMGYKYTNEKDKATVKSNLKKDSRNIREISITRAMKNGGFSEGNIITWFEFNNDNRGKPFIKLWYNENLREDITNLEKNYVWYTLGNILELRKTAYIRLYDLCRQWISTGHWYNVDLEKLKSQICRKEKSYDDWYEFRRNVLDPAVREINKKTDIDISYTTINKPGSKTIERLNFDIKVKSGRLKPGSFTQFTEKAESTVFSGYRNTGIDYGLLRSWISQEQITMFELMSRNKEELESRINIFIDDQVSLMFDEISKGIVIKDRSRWLHKALMEDYGKGEYTDKKITGDRKEKEVQLNSTDDSAPVGDKTYDAAEQAKTADTATDFEKMWGTGGKNE